MGGPSALGGPAGAGVAIRWGAEAGKDWITGVPGRGLLRLVKVELVCQA